MPMNGFKFEPVQKKSLVIELTTKLMEYIFSGSIQPGEKLPAERQLSESLGVGRSAIREAIKALTVLGILEVKQGYGTYLKRIDSTLLTRSIEWGILLGEKDTLDLIETRREIEVSVAKFAATRWDGSDLEELTEILERLKNSTISDFAEIDIQFHMKLCEMSKNSILKDILGSIQSLLRTWIICVIEKAGETSFSYSDHHSIYLAVAARDPKAAVKAMGDHMEDATRRLIEVIQEAERET